MAEKSEQPTARRLRRLQAEGDSPVSSALGQSIAFIVAVLVAPTTLARATSVAKQLLVRALEGREAPTPAELCAIVLGISVPLIAATALAALAVGFVQTGGVFALSRIAPDLGRVNPIAGLRNLVSAARLMSLARSLATALAIGYVAFELLASNLGNMAETAGNLWTAPALASYVSRRLAFWAALFGLALAAVDLALTRWSWLRRHRMSKDEIKREHREAEGDPEVRAARRRAHHEALEGNLIGAVKRATLVIVNPTHLATALRYEAEDDQAPLVVSQGRGDLARKIIEAAHAYGVPVIRDVPIARALAELEVGDEIPEALYEAVATILQEIWRGQTGEAEHAPGP